MEESQLPASGEGEVRGGWKSQARASESVLPADPRSPHLLRALPHNAHQGPSPLPDVPAVHGRVTWSSFLSSWPGSGSSGTPQTPLTFVYPPSLVRGDVEVLPGRGQSSVFPDKAVLMLPPHPAPGPLKVMVTMKRRGQEECRSQGQVCGGDGQTAPLRTVWKGL